MAGSTPRERSGAWEDPEVKGSRTRDGRGKRRVSRAEASGMAGLWGEVGAGGEKDGEKRPGAGQSEV